LFEKNSSPSCRKFCHICWLSLATAGLFVNISKVFLSQWRALCVVVRTEVSRVYYVVWWSGRWLSPVDDSPPPGLNTSFEQSVYTGDEMNLGRVRSLLVRGRVLSVGSVNNLLAAVRQAWLSLNSFV